MSEVTSNRGHLISILFTLILAPGLAATPALGDPALEIPYEADWRDSKHAKGWDSSYLERFDGDAPAEGMVPRDCARCHSTAGFHDFLGVDGSESGVVDKDALQRNGIACVACHNKVIKAVEEVTFPSGMSVEAVTADKRCMTCHQGRESTISVNELLESTGSGPDDVSDALGYLDAHYVTAATRYGSEAGGGYEYDGRDYEGFYFHDEEAYLCIDCHSMHTETVEVASCDTCHQAVKQAKDFPSIRKTKEDLDGDGDVDEGIGRELGAMQSRLYKAIVDYAAQVAGKPIVYTRKQYPYFFTDLNGNGSADDNEVVADNHYGQWTPRLVRAVYNLQFVTMDPGAYVHNPLYNAQLLHDSIADLGAKVSVDMTGMERP